MRRGGALAAHVAAYMIASVSAVFVGGCVAPVPAETAVPRTALAGDSPLVAAFTRAAAETGVPAELLAAIAHVNTRMRVVDGAHAHGEVALGILGLPPADLARGAMLAGILDDVARRDVDAGIRAGAALLRDAAPAAVTLDDFLAALRPQLRHAVETALDRGVDTRDAAGKKILVAARPAIATGYGTVEQAETLATGYPQSEWIPAHAENYGTANRARGDIEAIVVHTVQGSYGSCVNWFKNPDAGVSAHYVVRSSDGHVAQMVDEKNVAYHDRCYNTRTIGIEHEGYIDNPTRWYTEAMYAESAKLAAYLADKYGIAKEKGPIIGHGEAPDCSDHTDPGPGWDWPKYIDLVKTGGAPMFDAGDTMVVVPQTLISGERATVTVTLVNRGNTTWNLDATRLGTALPHDRESAFFVDGDWLSPNRATSSDGEVAPHASGTFTFDIIAPEVAEPTVYDEAFQLVEEGVTWFGPEIHVVTQIMPRVGDDPESPPGMSGGCSTTSGSSGLGLGALALGALLRRRRRV